MVIGNTKVEAPVIASFGEGSVSSRVDSWELEGLILFALGWEQNISR